jgi:hypothetical protein
MSKCVNHTFSLVEYKRALFVVRKFSFMKAKDRLEVGRDQTFISFLCSTICLLEIISVL